MGIANDVNHRARRLRDSRGQMSVELAITIPVLVIVLIIVCNLGVYLGDCARFDRSAPQVVRLHASSPDSDGYASSACVSKMEQDLGRIMRSSHLEVSVTEDGGVITGAVGVPSDSLVSFVPQPMNYTCTLVYTPFPVVGGAFGFEPVTLTHSRTYCIDPYRPGAIV